MDDLQNQAGQIAGELAEQLKDLRDIHLPEPVSFWPLAVGWWALLVIIPVLYFVIRFIVYRMRMPKYKKLAIQELAQIQSTYLNSKKAHETTGEIALLIRKALVAKLGNQAVAGLVTEEWLDYLDKLSQTDCFTNGTGRLIVSAPYERPTDKSGSDTEIDIEALLSATKKLLRRL